MVQSVFTGAYAAVLEVVIEARVQAGLSQADVGERLHKPQPWVSKVESGVRRLDVVEFYALTKALGANPCELFRRAVDRFPSDLAI